MNTDISFFLWLSAFISGISHFTGQSGLRPCPGIPNVEPDELWIKWKDDTCYSPGSFYGFDYEEAEAYCAKRNSTVVSIHSESENDFVVHLFYIMHEVKNLKVWIGLRKNVVSGTKSIWSDGSVISFSNFNDTQPEPLEHCVYLRTKFDKNDGKWFHANCGEVNTFVCKTLPKTSTNSKPLPDLKAYGNCEDTWYRFQDTCYKIIANATVFNETVNDCRVTYNAEPLSIHSTQQLQFIETLTGHFEYSSLWTGAYRLPNTNKFVWKSNNKWNFDKWLPNNPVLFSNDKNCVLIVTESIFGVGLWENADCDLKLPYICQKPISASNKRPSDSIFPEICSERTDYFMYRNACYKIYTENRSWTGAQAFCSANNASLASLGKALEHSLVHLMQRNYKSDLWIGLVGFNSDYQKFVWTDGIPLYFTNWNQAPEKIQNETQCVYQKISGLWTATLDCYERRPFICELKSDSLQMAEFEKLDMNNKMCPPSTFDDSTWIDLDFRLNFCYAIQPEYHDYEFAHQNCLLKKGNLANIQSEHEIKLLTQMTKSVPFGQYFATRIWTGLSSKKLSVATIKPTRNEGRNRTSCPFFDFVQNLHLETDCNQQLPYICAVSKFHLKNPQTKQPLQTKMKLGFVFFAMIFFFTLIIITSITGLCYCKYTLKWKRKVQFQEDRKSIFYADQETEF